jgi:hypothetical protein
MKKKKIFQKSFKDKKIFNVSYGGCNIFKVEINTMEIIPLIAELFREKWPNWKDLVELYEGKLIDAYLSELARAITAISWIDDINVHNIKKIFAQRDEFLSLDGTQFIKLLELYPAFFEKFDRTQVDFQEVTE